MTISKTNSLVELFFKSLDEVQENKPFLKWLKKDSSHVYTWGEVGKKIFKLSERIKTLIKEGDRCILLSENRPEWLIADLAIMNAGGISVPIFTTYAPNDYEYILKDCTPSLIIVSSIEQLKKVKNFIKNEKIISFEKTDEKNLYLEDIFKKEERIEVEINKNLKRSMPACIIYTSGTSGNPKGVILSHGGILSNCEGALSLLRPLIEKKSPIFLTWLPLSHSYEHTVQFIQKFTNFLIQGPSP